MGSLLGSRMQGERPLLRKQDHKPHHRSFLLFYKQLYGTVRVSPFMHTAFWLVVSEYLEWSINPEETIMNTDDLTQQKGNLSFNGHFNVSLRIIFSYRFKKIIVNHRQRQWRRDGIYMQDQFMCQTTLDRFKRGSKRNTYSP